MQLNLEFFDQPDVPPSAPVAWEQIDEAARVAAIEILARLISRLLQSGPSRQAMNERVKITSSHLSRQAVVYLRQSSAAQVEHNRESTERQYALVGKAREAR